MMSDTEKPSQNSGAPVTEENSQNTSAPVTEKSGENAESVTEPKDSSASSEAAADETKAPAEPQPITDKDAEKKARREAAKTLADTRKLFKRGKKQLSAERQKEIETALKTLENALKDKEHTCIPAYHAVRDIANKRLKFARKSGAQDVVESLVFALLFALVLRTFLIEPFKIPTRSMVPTLLEGDQLFVTKLSYGIRLPILNKYVVQFSKPQRGDVVVFAFPNQSAAEYLARTNSGCLPMESLADEKDYIKRIVGVEGDTIEVIDQVVYVNGEPVAQQPFYTRTVSDYRFLTDKLTEYWNRETLENASFTTITHAIPSSHFGPIKVEPGHVFAMGDNRDNSADSRCWGQVPIDNIKGRAQIIWWSTGSLSFRWNRMFTWIE